MTKGNRPIYPAYRDDDPIARLIVHYFYPTELMFKSYEKLSRDIRSGKKKPTVINNSNETSYLKFWLASLYAVAEGFKEAKLFDSEIDGMLSVHGDSLKRFRNGTFHYQPVPEKQAQFFQAHDRIEWARGLHCKFRRFFSAYAIEITVQAMMTDAGTPVREDT